MKLDLKNKLFLLDMFLIVGGRVPVTGMLAGMNLSKPGIDLSKPGMNLSKPGKKHRNHVIMSYQPILVRRYIYNESVPSFNAHFAYVHN